MAVIVYILFSRTIVYYIFSLTNVPPNSRVSQSNDTSLPPTAYIIIYYKYDIVRVYKINGPPASAFQWTPYLRRRRRVPRGAAPLWNAFTAKTIVVSTLEVVELITGASGITIQWTALLGTGQQQWCISYTCVYKWSCGTWCIIYQYIQVGSHLVGIGRYRRKSKKKKKIKKRRAEGKLKKKWTAIVLSLIPYQTHPNRPFPHTTVFFDLHAERLISVDGKQNGGKKRIRVKP